MARGDADTETGRICPKGVCDGSGWILGPEDVARPCECREERLRRGRANGLRSTIPGKFRGVSFDRPPVTEIDPMVVRIVRSYVDDIEDNLRKGRGMWLTGDTGTGKTTLAMLISKEALKRDYAVAIYSLPKLLARIRHTFEGGGNTYFEFFEQLSGVDLLFLDDIGAEKTTDWVVEQLYALINERYEAQRSIVITTNFTTDEILGGVEETLTEHQRRWGEKPDRVEVFHPRIRSRLIEICGDPLQLFGEDRRISVGGA